MREWFDINIGRTAAGSNRVGYVRADISGVCVLALEACVVHCKTTSRSSPRVAAMLEGKPFTWQEGGGGNAGTCAFCWWGAGGHVTSTLVVRATVRV
jgi:hypothetical protein